MDNKNHNQEQKMQLIRLFPERMRSALRDMDWHMEELEEIRIRSNQPIMFYYGDEQQYINIARRKRTRERIQGEMISAQEVQSMLQIMCNYSMYAYAKDLNMGFLTLFGGCRVGVAGEVIEECGKVLLMEHARFLNIRIAKERKGCADNIMRHLFYGTSIHNVLVISAPGLGKTTLLREIVRKLSVDENRIHKIAVVDERYEIAAAVNGVPQNDMGPFTDVISGCNKSVAMELVLRTMSPNVIAVDEVGGEADYRAVEQAVYSGVKVIATIHGTDIEDVKRQVWGKRWMDQGIFGRIIVIKRNEVNERQMTIYDKEGCILWS